MALYVGTSSPFEASFRDKGGEVGTFSVTGLPIDADTFDDNQALRVTFVAKLVAATLGVLIYSDYGGMKTVVNPISKAASASAQRENKVLVRYHDVTLLERMTATIPTINLPGLSFETDAKDFVALGTPTFISELVTAWQAFVVNPRNNALTIIDSIEYVGRNS